MIARLWTRLRLGDVEHEAITIATFSIATVHPATGFRKAEFRIDKSLEVRRLRRRAERREHNHPSPRSGRRLSHSRQQTLQGALANRARQHQARSGAANTPATSVEGRRANCRNSRLVRARISWP